MYKSHKIAVVIPARRGSKGIPNKNLRLLNGLPLFIHSINHAKNSRYVDKIIVSSDSKKILSLANKHGANHSGIRPKYLSNDKANLNDVLKYEIKANSLINQNYSLIVLLQPTSPLRPSNIIDDAIETLFNNKCKSLVSVSASEEHPIFMRYINDKVYLKKVIDSNSTIRRQDLDKVYSINGMIYINYINDVNNSKIISLNDNECSIIIPKKYAIDIDTMDDLKEARKKYKSLYK